MNPKIGQLQKHLIWAVISILVYVGLSACRPPRPLLRPNSTFEGSSYWARKLRSGYCQSRQCSITPPLVGEQGNAFFNAGDFR